MGVDGLLPLDVLRDDDYLMARMAASGSGSAAGAGWRPGVRLRVVVAAVNPVEGLIDLELAAD